MGYTCTPCTGTDVSFSTSGPGSSLGGAFSASVAPVFSPLQGSVTAVSPLGPETGTATFTPHYAQSSQIWQKESDLRVHAFPTLNMASVPTSSYRYENRFADLVSHCEFPGCRPRPSGAGGVGSSIRTMGPEVGPAEPARMSDDPSLTGETLPMITIDESKAVSLGGAGVQQQAAPDKAPPPTPVTPNRGEHCPSPSWWYNTATKRCYGGGYDDCNNDNSAGRHRCVKK